VDQEGGKTAPGRSGQASQVKRPAPRPFPAIDPEPAHRYTWRTARRAGMALAALAVAAGAVVLGTRLAQAPVPAPGRPAPAAAPFADGDGIIVFEQQPSGLLGTARPDGRGQALSKATGALQGNDIPIASPDRRYLLNAEGQLVTLSAAGPAAVAGLGQLQSAVSGAAYSANLSFADGSRSVAALQCDTITNGPPSDDGQKWIAHLYPTSGAAGAPLGLATSVAGDPAAPGAVVAVPVSTAAAPSCESPTPADSAIELIAAGQPARVVVTAVTLLRAAGWKPGTPVDLSAIPSPDGSRLVVTMERKVPPPPAGADTTGPLPPTLTAWFLVARSGAALSQVPAFPSGGQVAWSPDGTRVATCSAGNGKLSSVSVLDVSAAAAGGTARTITLPGRHDVVCAQLLWSPDGTQLIYSAVATTNGLTEAANLQHGWTVTDLRTGAVHDVAAPGQPAAWLPGRGQAA
jgi:hypothetical protein